MTLKINLSVTALDMVTKEDKLADTQYEKGKNIKSQEYCQRHIKTQLMC